MPRPAPGEIERRLGDLMDDLDKIARPDVPGHEIRTFYTSIQDITAYVWPHQAFAMPSKPSVPA